MSDAPCRTHTFHFNFVSITGASGFGTLMFMLAFAFTSTCHRGDSSGHLEVVSGQERGSTPAGSAVDRMRRNDSGSVALSATHVLVGLSSLVLGNKEGGGWEGGVLSCRFVFACFFVLDVGCTFLRLAGGG